MFQIVQSALQVLIVQNPPTTFDVSATTTISISASGISPNYYDISASSDFIISEVTTSQVDKPRSLISTVTTTSGTNRTADLHFAVKSVGSVGTLSKGPADKDRSITTDATIIEDVDWPRDRDPAEQDTITIDQIIQSERIITVSAETSLILSEGTSGTAEKQTFRPNDIISVSTNVNSIVTRISTTYSVSAETALIFYTGGFLAHYIDYTKVEYISLSGVKIYTNVIASFSLGDTLDVAEQRNWIYTDALSLEGSRRLITESITPSETVTYELVPDPLRHEVQTVVTVTGDPVSTRTKGGTTRVTITQSIIVNRNNTKHAQDSLNINETVAYVYNRYVPPITDTTDGKDNHPIPIQHAPYTGSEGQANRAIPGDLKSKFAQYVNIRVKFEIPEKRLEIELRPPDFSDNNIYSENRINRTTRGNTLIVYRDPVWPKTQNFDFNFSFLSSRDAVKLLDFLKKSLGLSVKFTDQWGQVYWGIIRNPEERIIQKGPKEFDVAIKYQVELQDDDLRT